MGNRQSNEDYMEIWFRSGVEVNHEFDDINDDVDLKINDEREISEFYVEWAILGLSFLASALHIRSAGCRISRVATFHLVHILYCSSLIWFAYFEFNGGKAIMSGDDGSKYPLGAAAHWYPCKYWVSSALWPWLPVWVSMALMLAVFFSNWDAVLVPRHNKHNKLVRRAVYSALVVFIVGMMTGFAAKYKHAAWDGTDGCYCNIMHCLGWTKIAISGIAFAETSRLSVLFIRTVHPSWRAGSRTDFIKAVVLVLFAADLLTAFVTICVGMFSPVYSSFHTDDPVCTAGQLAWEMEVVCPTSFFTLVLLWDRNYIQRRQKADLGDTELVEIVTDSPIFRPAEDSMATLEVENKLRSEILSAGFVALPESGGLTSELDLGSLHVPLKVLEDLRPPSIVLPLVAQFIESVALPAARSFEASHQRASNRLIEEWRPEASGDSSSVRSLEMKAQHDELLHKCSTISQEVHNWVVSLSVLVDSENFTTLNTRVFKPSKAKSLLGVAMLPTNMHIHTTAVENTSIQPSSPPAGQHLPTNMTTSTVTFGAPAAHPLKFKCGGLRKTESRMRSLESGAMKRSGNIGGDDDDNDDDDGHDDDDDNGSGGGGALAGSMKRDLELLRLRFNVHARECVVLSQALAAAVGGAADLLGHWVRTKNEAAAYQAATIGLLVHSVSLLSTQGKEEGMIDDFAGAFEKLNATLILTRDDDEAASRPSAATADDGEGRRASFRVVQVRPGGGGDRGTVTVVLAVSPPAAHAWMAEKLTSRPARAGAVAASSSGAYSHPTLRLVPVLFTLGVNEMQTLANAKKSTAIQIDINRRGLDDLTRYFSSFTSHYEKEQDFPELEQLMGELRQLVEAEEQKRAKLVDLLLVSCFCARAMNGVRTTSCKSAKDRTSVFQTLEVARLAERRGLYSGRGGSGGAGAETAEQLLLDQLRDLGGVRLRNCEHNIGRPKYSFNDLQLMSLPAELRPPKRTASGGGQS